MLNRSWSWLLVAVPVLCFSAPQQTSTSPAAFDELVRPFLVKNCESCHSSKLKSGGLNLQAYTTPAALQANRQEWENILQKLHSGEMPPKGMPRPDQSSVEKVTAWIAAEFDRQDRAAAPDPGRVTARRLNRAEYNNTIRDLLGIDFQPADDFPQDDSGYGFDNIGDVLSLSPLLMEKYMAAAETIAHTAVFGPSVKPSVARFQPPNRRRLEKNSEKEILFAPLTVAAPYTLQDYDITGLGQPSSIHVTHRFPATGEYEFKVAVGHNRPPGWDPLQMAVWIDGKIAATTEIAPDDRVNVVLTGDREALRDYRITVPSGEHWVAVTFLRQFEGVPASYGAPNPTVRPQPPPAPGAKPDTPDGIKVDWMTVTGPFHTSGPSPDTLSRIFVCDPERLGCDRAIVESFARRAFRRPVTPSEIDRYVGLMASARKRGRSFQAATALAIQAILVSPDFLFRIERDGKERDPEAPHVITDHELASRLSYFLWSSMPDQRLMDSADHGALHRPEVLSAEVRRMLADPKSRGLSENFAGQWLEIRRLESVRPDRERFPDFDDYLRYSMRKETELFFDYVVHQNRSVLDFINADYSFLNERLARHYKIPGIRGPEFRKVDIAQAHRRGVLTQASVLTVSSYANRTSPVLRGKWVLDNFLNAPPPPPPPDVPNLDTESVGTSASLRQQLELHRSNAVCASCHAKMDPLGFALENYDAVGQWRTVDGKFPIDASGALPSGESFHGARELTTVLAADPEVFTRCLTEKLLTYSLGRGLQPYDRPAVKEIVKTAAAGDFRFDDLVLAIVNSLPFQQRRGERPSDDRHT